MLLQDHQTRPKPMAVESCCRTLPIAAGPAGLNEWGTIKSYEIIWNQVSNRTTSSTLPTPSAPGTAATAVSVLVGRGKRRPSYLQESAGMVTTSKKQQNQNHQKPSIRHICQMASALPQRAGNHEAYRHINWSLSSAFCGRYVSRGHFFSKAFFGKKPQESKGKEST